ncbi:unnamed protein product [Clonostachys rhizophaga]|uniref:DUF4874 domain-containing protein n=1 Tax=Clonostachys rhizophaga TaxID=160324 RepID=A0A9N9VDR0_9HYPO|nr:unnamed protein product [Clonostachys rhizophaga]
MRFATPFVLATVLGLANAGFSTYKEIVEGKDNSDAITYYALDRSDTLFLYIQIISGGDHQSLISDFKTLVQNYGSQGISVIPRVRYGNSDGSVTSEPDDKDQILADVSTWAKVFSDVSGLIKIPVIQAGFLGTWGEWHDGPFCQNRGSDDSEASLQVKKSVVDALLGTGAKVAIRYPQDHKVLYDGDRKVTIHNDCIFNGGPNGNDGGTFPSDDRQTWIDYTKQVASSNTYGGEGCADAGDSTYDWSNFDDVCGSNGLEAYIHKFQISYFNPGNPSKFKELFDNSNYASCVDAIGAALNQYP